jgi:hypothetical protein
MNKHAGIWEFGGQPLHAQKINQLKPNLRLGKITRIDKYKRKEVNTRGKGK